MIEQIIESFDVITACYIAIFVIVVSMLVEAVVYYRGSKNE